jgi:creatinine amidohydrolase
MRIEEMTRDEFVAAVAKRPVVIVPFGACEAHGPHLPLGTDSYHPEALADEVARRLGGLVAPMVRYGQHSSTKKMPGTLSVRMETLKALAIDIMESLIANQLDKIVLVSGHAGTIHLAALKSACEEIVERHEVSLMMLTDYDIAFQLIPEYCGEEPDGHGGTIETARVMAIRPDLVKRKRGKGVCTSSNYMVVCHPEDHYPDGFVGDAKKATKEAGERMNQHIADELTKLIRKNFEV